MSLLVARFHTSANLYWQLFWQNYTVLGSNFQVSAKTRHFYYQQPFPFPFRLKELFKVLSVFDDCLVNETREGKKICTSLTNMHYYIIFAILLHICTSPTNMHYFDIFSPLQHICTSLTNMHAQTHRAELGTHKENPSSFSCIFKCTTSTEYVSNSSTKSTKPNGHIL